MSTTRVLIVTVACLVNATVCSVPVRAFQDNALRRHYERASADSPKSALNMLATSESS
ncbi:MAG: hypothetical protein ACYS7Y_10870 [Planctomycetota bacterium]